jgi:hypothetical protein
LSGGDSGFFDYAYQFEREFYFESCLRIVVVSG